MKRTISIKISKNRALKEFSRLPMSGHVACPDFEVETDHLTGLARHLAENIGTTWNGDDSSNVIVWSDKTQREIETMLWGTGAWFPLLSRNSETIEAYHNTIEEMYGKESLDTLASYHYQWGPMSDNETPVDFFNRVADKILAEGVSAVEVGLNRNRWESPAKTMQ